MTTASHHEVCGICHSAGPCEHNAPELPQAFTLRQWAEGWFAAGLMTVQVANAIICRMEPWLDRPFDDWATSVTWTDLAKLPQVGRRGIANVAGLLRLSGYDLRGYAIEADPRKLLDIRPE